MSKNAYELKLWLWLWLPVVLFMLVFGTAIVSKYVHETFFGGELGVIELATPLVLVPAIIAGFIIIINREKLITKQLSYWILFVTLACIYIAGEEISWGQQLVGWGTPEWVKEVNDQHETNLHNTSSWFDQKPRVLLEILIFIGGIYLPLKRKLQGINLPRDSWQYWVCPTMVCLPAATLAIVSRMPERIKTLFNMSEDIVDIRTSEVQELYFAIFLMIYLLSIRKRLALNS
jgi:hypothetical protein